MCESWTRRCGQHDNGHRNRLVEAVDIPLHTTEGLLPEAEQFLFVTPYSPGGFLGTAHHLTAGSAIEWHRGLVGSALNDMALYGLPAEAILGPPSSLIVLPQFAGSFVPKRNPGARAAIMGLSLDTSATDIARALLEGLVFELRVTIENMERIGLQVGELRNGGGGSRSELWMRLKATVLGKPIALPEIVDSSCLGAAILAALLTGASRTLFQLRQRWYACSASTSRNRPSRAHMTIAIRNTTRFVRRG